MRGQHTFTFMKHRQSIIIFFIVLAIYTVVGVVFILLFPDQHAASTKELQNEGDFSRVSAVFVIIVRSIFQILFWPGHALVLLAD